MSKKFHIFAIILLILNTFEPSKAFEAISAAMEMFGVAENIWAYMSEIDALESIEKKTEALQNKMNQLNYSKIEKVEIEFGNISYIIGDFPENIIQYQLLRELQNHMIDLDALYGNFETFSKNIGRYPSHTLEAFANMVLSETEGLVERIRGIVMPSKYVRHDKGILRSVADSLRMFTPTEQCKLNKSPHQIVYNMYNYFIPSTTLKAFSMEMFSYILLRLYDRGDFTSLVQLLREKSEVSIQENHKLLINIIQPVSRDIWKCDPTIHLKGRTYLSVTRLLQEYIQNLVDLNKENTCSGTCESLDITSISYSCTEELCRYQRRCEGKVIGCSTLHQNRPMQVCLAHPYRNSRYHYIDFYTSHKDQRVCPRSPKVLFLEAFVRKSHQCEYCYCYCDDKGDRSDRYFNMRPVMADIKNNRVITGLRFVNKNRIFHLQIQEAKLLPGGTIDVATVKWVPVKHYKINDTHVKSGEDYHVLSWEQRRIDLNDVLTHKGQVLTGIRLTKDEKESFLKLQITGTTFNLSSGLLNTTEMDPNWISSNVSTRELKLEKPKLSILSPSPSVPDSTSDSYVKFTHITARDIAQNTVPYLDAQPVESLAPVPLGGAGLYHKGRRGYGGFIAPKIITYDFYN